MVPRVIGNEFIVNEAQQMKLNWNGCYAYVRNSTAATTTISTQTS